MKRDRILSLLGLSKRAGKIAAGEYQAEQAVRAHKAFLVVVSGDASDNTRKKFRNMCEYHHTPLILYGDKESLGNAVGFEMRAILAVLDEGLARAITSLYADSGGENTGPADGKHGHGLKQGADPPEETSSG